MAFKFPTFKYDTNLVAQPDVYTSPLIFKPDLESTPPLSSEGKASGDDRLYGLIEKIYDPKQQDAREKAKLQNLLTLQKEQMSQAAPYKLMFELPDRVMKAFAAPAQISSNIRLAGQGAANQLIAQGLQASALNMPSMGYQRPSTQYF